MDQQILANMVVELKRGTQIIAVLSQLSKNQYGYSLLQSLEEKGILMEAGTLYPLLRRLEAQGLLQSEWDTSEARPRKYYILSQQGQEIYQALKIEWKRLINEIEHILEEEK